VAALEVEVFDGDTSRHAEMAIRDHRAAVPNEIATKIGRRMVV
jgi:hypothetical protein